MQTWNYPGSKPQPYTTTLHDDGLLECDCQGWRIRRKDKPRACKHTDDVVKRNKLNTVRRGDHLYVADAGTVELIHTPPPEDHAGALALARANGYINPMLAIAITGKTPEQMWDKLNADYLTGWYWEEKWDGERSILSVRNHQIVGHWSRPRPGEGELGNSRLTGPKALPEYLRKHAEALPDGTYDTEDIVTGGRSWAVSDARLKDKHALMFFDLPIFLGQRIADKPIEARRLLLEETLRQAGSPFLLMSQTFPAGRAGVEQIWARGGEGAMLKRYGSIYREGYRGPDWVKVKLFDYTSVTLTHFEEGKEGPYAKMAFVMDDGVVSTCKTLGHKWLREFEKNGAKYLKQRFVLKHQGRTDDHKKPRHGQFDHFVGEGE
jgi:hypothetical protein